AASDEKIFRQSKQKAARIVDPIRRIFVTNDGKDSVDSLCEGFLEVPSYLSIRFIASFAFVLQRLRAKPILLCRAGVYSRRLSIQDFITAGASPRPTI
ncbi:MAG: hypothetical protein IKM33_04125, partial [Clostridia bacterium]|nr:hypothetical protein [Clostridia bacterium]